MKFIDELLRDTPDKMLYEVLKKCQYYDCSNVADYFFDGTDQEIWSLAEFPAVTPPAPQTWLEFRAPKQLRSVQYGTLLWGEGVPKRWGVLYEAEDVTAANLEKIRGMEQTLHKEADYYIGELNRRHPEANLEEVTRKGSYQKFMEIVNGWSRADQLFCHEATSGMQQWKGSALLLDMFELCVRAGARWMLTLHLFLDDLTLTGNEPYVPLWRWWLGVDELGQITHMPDGKKETFLVGAQPLSFGAQFVAAVSLSLKVADKQVLDGLADEQESLAGKMTQILRPLIDVAFLSVSFMNCHNVTIQKTTPPKKIIRNKSARRRGEKDYQPVTYGELVLSPLRPRVARIAAAPDIASARAAEETVPMARRAHFVRGHFVRYDGQEGRGLLFGKYKKIVWHPLTRKGSEEAGQHTKDYRINLD